MATKNKKSSFSFKGRVRVDSKKGRGSSGGGSGTKYLNLPNGIDLLKFDDKVKKVQIDIIPYIVSDKNHPNRDDQYQTAMVGDPWYKRPIRVHTNIGPKNEKCICLASLGKKCPICEYQNELFDQNKREEAIALYPQDRVLYYVIPRDSEKHDEVVYIWDMSFKMFQETLDKEIDEDEEYEEFPSLENGKTLEIKFKWKTIGDKGKPYPEVVNVSFLDRDPLDESLMDDLPSFDDLLNVLSYKELEAKFLGEDIEEEDDDDEKPARKVDKKTPPSMRPGKFEKEQDDDDDEQEKPTWEELMKMNNRKLKKVVSDFDLSVDPDDFEGDESVEFVEAIAEELEIENTSKKASAKKPEKKAEKKEELDLTWEDIDEMSIKQLNKLVDSEELSIDTDEYDLTDPDSEAAYRTDIATELGIKIPGKKSTAKEPAKPAKTAKASKEPEKPAKGKCPFGHKFGVDTDNFDDCGKCKVWDDCDEQLTKKK